MIWYQDQFYGADADGKRYTTMWFYDFEPSDKEWLKEKLQQLVDEGEYESLNDLPDNVFITVINPYTEEDVEVQIFPKEIL